MPELPVIALECPGQTDPHVHAGQVARAIAPVLEGSELVVVQETRPARLAVRWAPNLPRFLWPMSKQACAATTA